MFVVKKKIFSNYLIWTWTGNQEHESTLSAYWQSFMFSGRCFLLCHEHL